MKKKLFYILILAIAGIQFVRIDKTNPVIDSKTDYINVAKPTDDVYKQLRASCYDCHSNESVYPWYSNVAPVSWLVKSDIYGGREHVNFSEWGKYSESKQISLKEDIIKEITEDEMPLSIYTLMHSTAKLDDAKKELLTNWFKK